MCFRHILGLLLRKKKEDEKNNVVVIKPVKVIFRTKDGKKVVFNATKAVRKRKRRLKRNE